MLPATSHSKVQEHKQALQPECQQTFNTDCVAMTVLEPFVEEKAKKQNGKIDREVSTMPWRETLSSRRYREFVSPTVTTGETPLGKPLMPPSWAPCRECHRLLTPG